ncbi:MAG: hypothetical protein DHS20C11_36270 [Lysobacteraceae bacterium]|nr:MAG: hypothetical protein DHS20C11_36270 [Xanthomonadaceae bacterium]
MALAACLAFLTFAVVGRILLQLHLTGDHGIRPARQLLRPTARSASAIICIVSALLVIVISAAHNAGWYQPTLQPFTSLSALGVAICLIGIAITVIAQWQMGRSWRIGVAQRERTELVTHGLYSFSRNPIYTGVFIFGVGLLALLPDCYLAIVLIIGFYGVDLHVRHVEEPHMANMHSSEFAEYCARVGRYWPRSSGSESRESND